MTDSVDPDEAAHNEPPHQGLCCLQIGDNYEIVLYFAKKKYIMNRPKHFLAKMLLIRGSKKKSNSFL